MKGRKGLRRRVKTIAIIVGAVGVAALVVFLTLASRPPVYVEVPTELGVLQCPDSAVAVLVSDIGETSAGWPNGEEAASFTLGWIRRPGGSTEPTLLASAIPIFTFESFDGYGYRWALIEVEVIDRDWFGIRVLSCEGRY